MLSSTHTTFRILANIRKMKREKRNRILHLLQEIGVVVVGVLIAVSIGNYKEKLDNKKYVEKTLMAIENEVRLSQGAVDTVLNKHLNLIDSLKIKIYENEQTLGEVVGDLGGVQFAVIRNISLRFFISNKAELVDFEIISQLLVIEEQTKILSDKTKRLADFAYEHMNDKESDTKLEFVYMLMNVIDSEESLLKSYSLLLNEKKKLPK